ncbi:MAG: CHASE4 domain-containing protein [Chloroflexota bacterium]|nr:CHASE4 domain-containing protein [Chloroflexota bacterium]
MALRKKTLIIVSITTFSLIMILYAASRITLLGSFTELENQFVRRDVGRATSALTGELDALDAVLFDWAAWDDTYRFIKDGNEAYIESNFVDETFTSIRLNLVLLVNPSGQIVFGKGFDLHNEEEVPVPQSIQDQIIAGGLLLHHPDTEGSLTGLLLLPEGDMLVASRPILTSAEEGPIRGTMVMGRYLDSAEIERLAEITHLSLTIRRFDDAQMPPDFQAADSSWSASSSERAPVFVQPLSAQSTAGYALLEDIYGKPSLVLRVDTPREIYRQGQASALYFMSALLVVSLVFGWATMLLLERVVLSRLIRLIANVRSIGASGDLSARIAMTGKDELSDLADEINVMLAELEQSRSDLQESEERYRLLFHSGNDIILVSRMTNEGLPDKLIEVNDVACRRLDYTRKELLRLSFLDIADPEDQGEFPALGKKLSTEKQVIFEAAGIAKNGDRISVEVNAHLFDLSGQPAVLSIARDIAERKRAEQVLKRRNRELATLYEAAMAISSDLSLDAVLQTVAKQMTRAFNSSGCALSLCHQEQNLIETLVDYSTSWPDETELPGTTYDLNDYPATRHVLETGQTLLIQHNDPTADEAELALMKEWRAFTLLMLPLIVRDRVVGLVELIDDVETRDYTPEEIRLAESLAAQAAVAIENARLYKRAQQEITERQWVEEVLRESEQRFRDVANTTGDWIWEVEAEGRYTYISPVAEQVLGYTPAEMLGRHYTDLLHHSEESEAGIHTPFLRKEPFLGFTSSHMHRDGHEVILETSGLPLTDTEGNLLGYRGVHRDITAERRLSERLRAIQTVGKELVLSGDRQKVAEAVVDAARLLLRCQRCALWQADKGGEVLTQLTVKAGGREGNITTLPVDGEESITQAVAQSGEPVYLPDVREAPRYVEAGTEMRSVLCVPLEVEEQVIGVLNVESEKVDAFDEDDQRLLSTLADQAALALENARLYEAVTQQREQLRALAMRLAEAEEAERQRLARELHDQVGQNLTALGLNLNIVRSQIPDEMLDVHEVIHSRMDDSLKLVMQMTERIRGVMADLRPPVLEDYGLVSALRWYAAQFSSRVGITVTVPSEESIPRLATSVENGLFRIAQEALTNVAKHAQATRATVTVDMDGGAVRMIVADDGVGFDPARAAEPDGRRGWGLLTMAERAEAVGGHFRVESGPQQGTRVVVEVAQ